MAHRPGSNFQIRRPARGPMPTQALRAGKVVVFDCANPACGKRTMQARSVYNQAEREGRRHACCPACAAARRARLPCRRSPSGRRGDGCCANRTGLASGWRLSGQGTCWEARVGPARLMVAPGGAAGADGVWTADGTVCRLSTALAKRARERAQGG